MPSLLRGLRKILGIFCFAVGFFTGALGLIGAAVYAWRWLRGEPLHHHDRDTWRLCVAAAGFGSALVWAGIVLLRVRQPGPAGSRSLGLVTTGRQRRYSPRQGVRNTLVWLVLGAEILLFKLPGDPATKLWQTLFGVGALYLGLQATFLLHELGHLGVAALFGFDLQKLQVGTGPRLAGIRLGALHVEWHAWLGGGFVLTADHRERGWRWRHWLYVAGGPAATLAGCAALAGWLRHRHPDALSWEALDGMAEPVAAALLGYGLLFLLGNLIPKWARVGTVRARTDGYKLLHALRYSTETVRLLVITTWLRGVEFLWDDGRRALAWESLRELLARHAAEPALAAAEGYYLAAGDDHAGAAVSYGRWLQSGLLDEPVRVVLVARQVSALSHAHDPEAARRCAADALREVSPGHRVRLLDALATEVLGNKQHALLPEADAWSQEALALEPDTITLKGTRGAVLVELGRPDEGEALLREVWSRSASEVDAAISAFYLGVAAKRRQDVRESRRWFRRAQDFAVFTGKWLSTRINEELAATS